MITMQSYIFYKKGILEGLWEEQLTMHGGVWGLFIVFVKNRVGLKKFQLGGATCSKEWICYRAWGVQGKVGF